MSPAVDADSLPPGQPGGGVNFETQTMAPTEKRKTLSQNTCGVDEETIAKYLSSR